MQIRSGVFHINDQGSILVFGEGAQEVDEFVFCLKAIPFRLFLGDGLLLGSAFVFGGACVVLVVLDGTLWNQAVVGLLAVRVEGGVGMVDFLAFEISTPELVLVLLGC